jgi:hypothetical protein
MDLSGPGIVLIFIILVFLALIVALKLLSTSDKQITTRQIYTTPLPGDESNFLTSFLKPIYDDGLSEMETAVDALKDGLDFYGRGAYVNAGEQFIDAGRSVEAATAKFREVLTLVEYKTMDYAKFARHRLTDCKRFQELAGDMEKACDEMLAGKTFEARVLEEKSLDGRKRVEAWNAKYTTETADTTANK